MSEPDQDGVAWCVIDGVAVFLDIPGDRYFRLQADRNRHFLKLSAPPCDAGPVQPPGFPRPRPWTLPSRQCDAIHDPSFSLADVARAMWTQRRTEHQLTTRPLLSVLGDLQAVIGNVPFTAEILAEPQLREVRAFERAKLLRSAADRCLPRSIALALCLARRGCRAHVVLGVKIAPFCAHCWVQVGDQVLNDEVEEVLRYAPILII